MSQIHVATQDRWVICFSNDQSVHNFNALAAGTQIETGLPNMETFDTEAEANARYVDFVPDWTGLGDVGG